MANSNFYDELDLRYPEIAICLDRIDRTNPGVLRFTIPILTPNMSKTSSESTKVQQNNSFLENKNPVNVGNVTIQNYIKIRLPKELCGFVGVTNSIINSGSISLNHTGRIKGEGTVGPIPDCKDLDSTSEITGNATLFKGTVSEYPVVDRYIAAGSKWIVVFIGGDIGKPQIIGRYYDPE